jgi:nucleoid-associated protein
MEEVTIKINHLIIHELIKRSGEKQTNSHISKNALPENHVNSIELIRQLEKSYDSTSIAYANFSNDSDKKFQEHLNDYLTNEGRKEFLSFSTSTFVNLSLKIGKVSLATGGFYVYAGYTVNEKKYLAVFLIRESKVGIQLNWEEKAEIVDIKSVDYLDTNNLAMACRIEIDKYTSNQLKYLTFTSKKQRDVSEYFKNWISISSMESSREYTKTLIDVLENIEELPRDEQGNELKRGELISKACNIITNQSFKLINVDDLSKLLFNDSSAIRKFAQKIDKPLDTEFQYDTYALNNATKISIKADDIELKFFKGQTYKVRIPQSNPDIVIIESKEFANSFREKSQGN